MTNITSKKSKSLVFVLGAVLLTTSCASKKETRLPFDEASIEKQMILSAKAVAESKQIRARAENAIRIASLSETEKEKFKEMVSYIPPGMDIPIDFNERMEAERMLKLIAQMTRWDFEPRGKVPVNGAMVYINSQMTPAIDIIYNIESQIKDRARIILVEYEKGNEKNGMIILDYKPSNL